jgi:hypothetical protein
MTEATVRNKGFNSNPTFHFLRFGCVAIPWSQGKTQGISPNPPPFSEIRLENLCASSSLRGNSLRGGAGNFSCAQGIVSAFSTAAGKMA